MWIWWRLRGERPLPGIHGALVGQPVRRRGQSAITVVTRVVEGVTWGRRNGSHESEAAAIEVATDNIARRPSFTRDDEAALVADLVRQFNLSEERAAGAVAAVLSRRR